MSEEVVRNEEIRALYKMMGVNKKQFARLVGAKSSAAVDYWIEKGGRPTGERYEKLLELKKKYLMVGPETPKPMREVARRALSNLDLFTNTTTTKVMWDQVAQLMNIYDNMNPETKKAVLKQLRES